MEIKFDKNNKILVTFLLITIIIFIIVYVNIRIRNNSVKKDSKIDTGKLIENHQSTENMKEHVPLIDMNNTQNAKIQSGEKINLSENMKKEKNISGLKFKNINLHTESGLSYFNAVVENTEEKDFEGKIVTLKFKNNDGGIVADVEATIPTIKAKGTAKVNASTTADIVNAYDIEIIIN